MAEFRANVLLRDRSYRGHLLGALFVFPVVALLLDAVLGYTGSLEVLAALSMLAFFFGAAHLPENFLRREARGPIVAKREGLFFRGECVAAREAIRNVALEGMAGGKTLVHVFTQSARKDLRFELPDGADGHAFLEALELAPEHRVASFSVHADPLRTRTRQIVMRVLAMGGVLLPLAVVGLLARRAEAALLLAAPVLLAYGHLLSRLRRWTDVRLGADGITLRQRGKNRSIPLSAIRETKHADNVVHVIDSDGAIVPLHFGAANDEKATAQRIAFTSGLEHALERREGVRDVNEARLVRGDRDLEAWRAEITLLAHDAPGFRTAAAVPTETLWRIAEDVAAEPTARAGAIAALQARGMEEDAPVRLRVIAEQSAQGDLRAAAEAAAEGASADEVLETYARVRAE